MIKPCAVVNYHETGRLIYYRNKSRLTQTVHAQTGYRLVKETQEDNGNLGDWLTAQQIDWCTVETCVGKAPVSRLQLLTEYRRHDTLIPAIAGIYAEHSFLSTAGRKSQV
jgi:hypothetical protein